MRSTIFTRSGPALGLALAIALLSPYAASAQSELDASQAEGFMGEWVVDMDTDFGPFSMNLEIEDQAGKVAASVGSPDLGGMQSVTDIEREGESLVMTWEVDAQGQFMEVIMTLVPAGENLATMFETAGGEFAAAGTATRPAS